jgi:hypothetical protein
MAAELTGVLDVDEHGLAIRCPANARDLAARRAHQEAGDIFGGDVGYQHLVIALVQEVAFIGSASIGLDPKTAFGVDLGQSRCSHKEVWYSPNSVDIQ